MTKTKVCECGGSYEDVKSKKERHMNSKKHQTFVASEKAREETIENKQEETIENKQEETREETNENTTKVEHNEHDDADGFKVCGCGGNISKNYPICRHKKTKMHIAWLNTQTKTN